MISDRCCVILINYYQGSLAYNINTIQRHFQNPVNSCYFCKIAPSFMFHWVLNTSLLFLSSYFGPSPHLKSDAKELGHEA